MRGSKSTADGSAHPDMQLTLMNVRSATLIAGAPERRQLAGDQFFVDLDLSVENIPPGSRLKLGDATVEITEIPHRGCGKFSARFGVDALKFVNSEVGRELNLRGVNAKIIDGGVVRRGDAISKT
jgi:MOSC domain-containing protein YiiM